MTRTFARSLALAAALMVPLVTAARAVVQDAASMDDALDSLLKKLEGDDRKAEGGGSPAADNAGKSEKGEPSKGEPKGPGAGPSSEPGKAPKPASDVSGKDKDLDSLLEKLGATEDKPSPDDRRRAPGGAGEPDKGKTPPDSKGDRNKDRPDSLSGKAKDLDEHLEELSGKRRKKKDRDEVEAGGPLSDVIKQMREVEQRLGKPDTGEETRKTQSQIVKRLENLIEQSRSRRSQSRQRQNMAMRPGRQPGQPEDQPGTTGGNAPFTKPQKPTDRRSMAGGKDIWGHLPPELRNELDNASSEEPLPSRAELIKRYYLSVGQKTLSRGR